MGKIRTAASGATIASLACLWAFVILPNLSGNNARSAVPDEGEIVVNPDNAEIVHMDADSSINFLVMKRVFFVHATMLAVVSLSAVHTLEPSLKSLLSLMVPRHLQNRSLGFMSTLGGIGGMGGNLLGTRMFTISKQWNESGEDNAPVFGMLRWLSGGVWPFAVVGSVLGIAALFLWILDLKESRYTAMASNVPSSALSPLCEENCSGVAIGGGGAKETTQKSSASGKGSSSSPVQQQPPASNTNANSSHGLFFPLLSRETSYEMKLD